MCTTIDYSPKLIVLTLASYLHLFWGTLENMLITHC
uniref:Uncharacterized protein n=1 Tax=Rhizophora mucronata TaxID=61149 RepID=A0A2P2QJ39_RHIMU